ncbi:aminotransferase [Halovulum dunhuangense]|uniref:aspartate transaminase n=1 Tax=Halovulum dunhuangense TaxID=1505036 RepID=A0A849L393_9RHOB|nr:aminotransferase [Halovulum dunhuangense]NNU80690.1 aminotransferase [Halovulum dunhuangense]
MPVAPFGRNLSAAFPPPVMEARAWAQSATLPPDMPLLNLSQAAPVDPPPEALRQEIARAALEDPGAHVYGPVLGMPELREEIAARWSALYRGRIHARQVAITAGCNEAFAAAIASVADPGDAVILPVPWYFNHKMWLDMNGIETRLLPCGAGMLPDPEQAAALIDDRVKAIVLVSPNNPTGAEYPPALIAAFAALARARGIALILDETYRDFHSAGDAPHALFAGDWADVLIHLYSFSKVFRLTGHRIGALIASERRLAQIEKFLDTVTICPNQLGQRAALHGLRHLGPWVAEERAEILRRRAAVETAFTTLPGWRLLGSGAYFAYLEHPWDRPSDQVAQWLVAAAGLLVLPGTMFGPRRDRGGDGSAERQLRIAFANADGDGIAELARRLAQVAP